VTKAELVEEVSRVSDLTKKDAEVIVDTVFKSIVDALHRGEKIELRGFGSFRLRQREPRKGRNPKTGDKVDVPPKKVPYFKPGKELKDLINKAAEAEALDNGAMRQWGNEAIVEPSPHSPIVPLPHLIICRPCTVSGLHGACRTSPEPRGA
jgi:integration host factor subunit beta